MKKTRKLMFAGMASLAMLAALAASVAAQDLTAFQVLDRARANWQGDTFHGLVTLDVTQAGQLRSYRVETWTQGNDLGLVRFLGPEADAGSGYLMNGDELWYYSPAAGRAVSLPQIAISDSLFGNGPALEDLRDQYT
jgi:hypothetical protein